MAVVEAAQIAVRYDPSFANSICIAATRNPRPWPSWRRRKLAVRFYWMLRSNGLIQIVRIESSPRVAMVVRPGG
jgi:hypothetical protein